MEIVEEAKGRMKILMTSNMNFSDFVHLVALCFSFLSIVFPTGRMKQQIEEKKRKLRIAGKPVIVDEDNPIYLKKAIAIMIMKLFADLERKRMGHEDKVNIISFRIFFDAIICW